MRLIDADALCEALLKRWNTADQNAEEIISELMAKVVTPIVVGMPTIEPCESADQNVADVPSGDLISREEVHKVLSLLATEGGKDAKLLFSDAHEFIDALPSADAISIAEVNEICSDCEKETNKKLQHIKELSARPKGKWIMHIDDLFPEESTQECSNCHEHETIQICNDNFCPCCGADMRPEK